MSRTLIKNAVVISDTHLGDQLALCPDKIMLRHGGIYRPSKFQRFINEKWKVFWDEWVPKVTRGEDFVIVINGDSIEGRHHKATHPISQDKSDQEDIAYEVLAPIVERCKGRLYMIGGSEAHAGLSAEDEERLAKRLGAIPDESGNRSRFELYLKVGKAVCHFAHHIGTTSSMAYESTALAKEYSEFCAESARWREPIPDIVVRSHRHRHMEVRVPTDTGYGIIFVTSSWQLNTPFTFKLPGGRVTTPMIGGSLIRQGDEEFYTRHCIWKTKRSPMEIA
jgi:hypothetical protein